MSATHRETGNSADVRMHLSVNGQVFAIAQLGPDFLILRDAAEHPPADGEISLSIDSHTRRWRVQLPDGMSSTQRRIRICRFEQANGSTAG